MKRKRRKAISTGWAVLLGLAVVLTGCGPEDTQSGANGGVGASVEAAAVQEEGTAALTEEAKEAEIDFESLKARNEDIYAWITIPGTEIDYPVVQRMGSEDLYDNFYLNHTVDLVEGYPGAVYSQPVNRKDFMDSVTVLYGHNMKDGSMFGCLHDYADKDYFDRNHTVVIHTPDNVYLYEIFAAVDFSDALLPYEYDFSNSEEVQRYLDDIRECAGNFREGMEVSKESRILTLSTCYSTEDSKRLLVEAVLVEEIGG